MNYAFYIPESVVNSIYESIHGKEPQVIPDFYARIRKECTSFYSMNGKFYPAPDDSWKPVHFMVSVRTDENNVLVDSKTGKFFFEADTSVFLIPGISLEDTVLRSCKLAVDKYFDFSNAHVPTVIRATAPTVPGVFINKEREVYVYCVLVVSSKMIKEYPNFKIKDSSFVGISSITPSESGVDKVLHSALYHVKEVM